MIGWAIYAAFVAFLAGIVAVGVMDMWQANDRQSAVLFGASFGAITLVLILGPFVG